MRKFVHDDSNGKLTLYVAYSDKTEPNEDATVVTTATQTRTAPYVRPFLYPNFDAHADLSRRPARTRRTGRTTAITTAIAQRTDYLGYVKYDWNVSDRRDLVEPGLLPSQ